ncbi:UDP-N-acetylmuramate dehydrogenase [Defluviitalea raffinosedens]|uniref:UDP-N-acetylenolpyruvoylglucosamine reductase n=2 Tax=Defluviitalea raffinosedens TaxID=1450156 RepID=A0A7C8HG69_9FIRM|nr:UDP-N-acetylmuramate dehydrogenase [Defluviitalea raffinosedens]KAE9635676.1 UDP-N-acetylmuramate dehydrogenase [Defluviitalea raffinosedens]HHW68497.1 UDP-N-acetylmuramate dehydrogenase [Candidatus Epulonipiscium sp.]
MSEYIPRDLIKINEPMKDHTSFKAGGCADFFIVPENSTQLIELVQFLKESQVPYYIMGNGSNLLVRDKGFRGVIIQIYRNMSDVKIDGEEVWAEAGILLSSLSNKIMNSHLTGFEFASGIPGTLGGAIYMNAGAYGGEMKQVLVSADVVDEDGKIITLTNEELKLGYRSSILQQKKYIVLSAKLKLQEGDIDEIKARINYLTEQRKAKQPLELPSAGSTFKRPEGYYAGKLIMDAGLRGYSIGDAQVSEKHCGFVVNKGNASAGDIIKLIHHIQNTVKEKFGVFMEPEVRIIGEE